jgi:Cysteine-rich domain
MKVALFVPCYIDQFYPQVAVATLELLEKLGCEVSFPAKQTCCGQPMANSGYEHLSVGCDANFQEAFTGQEYVVCPSGSCTLHVKEHVQTNAKVFELTEFIYDVLGIKTLKGTDAGWTGGITVNVAGAEAGYQNFSGYRTKDYPGFGVGGKYPQTSYQQSLNKASTYLQIGTARAEYFGAAWFQNFIHNNISHESTYDYNYRNKINVSGGIQR